MRAGPTTTFPLNGHGSTNSSTNIVNNSGAAAGLLVTGTNQVAGIIGSGNLMIDVGGNLTANRIQQASLESSNVNAVTSAVQLVTVQRYADLMQRALYLFHTEMNQIATQELPKLSNG